MKEPHGKGVASHPGPEGTPTPLSKAEYTYDASGWRDSRTDLDGSSVYSRGTARTPGKRPQTGTE